MAFKDHFSRQAADYAAYRPVYPPELFAWLAALCPARCLAWDAGCGSGQASLGLAVHFASVQASDPSARQIEQAPPHPRVTYHVAAERLPALGDAAADLITVAQALHWFDQPEFLAETARVAAPGAVLAVWSYDLPRLTPSVDAVIDELYARLDPWWPPERRAVETRYAGLVLPGRPLAAPDLAMTASWTPAQLLGYLASWSAVTAQAAAIGGDALAGVPAALRRAWGDPGRPLPVSWPLTVLASRLP